ncbi:MAG: aminopeptidase [candidate division KSB1 bacterium]|nr:aminopeptidase [candidate division KSB1 bacterium]
MFDPRLQELTRVVLDRSCKVQPGEIVLIQATDVPEEWVVAFVRATAERGAVPLAIVKQGRVLRELYRSASAESMRLLGQAERLLMEQAQVYIGLRGGANAAEMADVPEEKMRLFRELWWKPVHQELRIRRTRWVVLRHPGPSMAQQAGMSTEAFEEFYFRVCTLDYSKMERAMPALVQRLANADRVVIVGPGTELELSIKGVPCVPCFGQHNLPDGEVFTAPVRQSVEGKVRFNAPTVYRGIYFDRVELEFRRGEVVRADAGDRTPQLEEILASDEGSRYVGEFALGLNPLISRPMRDILFDEKIAGSFHLALGQAYQEADNGNRSQLHWDLISVQAPEWGGGEIWLDGELLRKDGRFVPDDLQGLNPENLV